MPNRQSNRSGWLKPGYVSTHANWGEEPSTHQKRQFSRIPVLLWHDEVSSRCTSRGLPMSKKSPHENPEPAASPSNLPTLPLQPGGTPRLPDRIGPYRVQRLLGEGGMGVVYEAEQEQPRRAVALKVIRGGTYVDDTRVRLFQREVQTLARLRHAGIATIYESGCTEDGQHYFAMELVPGEPLDAFLATRSGPVSSRAELEWRLAVFRKLCAAVAYAHQRGIIHRDLKPSNIMVVAKGPSSDQHRRSDVPEIKVLDFGLARMTDRDVTATTVMTSAGELRGTLPYMSPEQVRGNPDDIDLRSDVYALGIVLYEMLCGRLPYDLNQAGIAEAARIISEEPPCSFARLAERSKSLDREMENIVFKALEKDVHDRYQSVTALADDLERYLTGQPLLARPPSTAYQLRKLIARHKVGFGFAAAFVFLLIGFAATMVVQAQRIGNERDRANLEAAAAGQVSTFLIGMFQEADPGKARGSTITAREIIDRGAETIDRDLRGQPQMHARMLGVMGQVYLNLGLFESAETLLTQAVEIQASLAGDDSLAYARALNQLGWSLVEHGDYERAGTLHAQAQEIFLARQDAAPEDRAWTDYYLGSIAARSGAFDEAEIRLTAALEAFQDTGTEPKGIAWCLNDLGVLYAITGDFDRGRPLLEQALAIKQDLLGSDHWDVALGHNTLGAMLHNAGYDAEARPHVKQALEVFERVLPPGHPRWIITTHTLSDLERQAGNQDTARDLLERALAAVEIADDKEMLGIVLDSLADLHFLEGQMDEAESHYLRALEVRSKLLVPTHPDLVDTLTGYAGLLRATGREQEAVRLEARATQAN